MKTIKALAIIFLFCIGLIIVLPFQSCEREDDDEQQCDTCIMVLKPNIYIYPENEIQLMVELDFPLGGNVVTSIPQYENGWNVTIDTNGLIDNSYSYLFYESMQPDIWQRNYGWIIEVDDLESFFRNNLIAYGFYGQEIQDFIDYWVSRLNGFSYYTICPQTNEIIDSVIDLSFSKQPDDVLRLFYVIQGYDYSPEMLIEPKIDSFNREFYFVVEWGVVLD